MLIRQVCMLSIHGYFDPVPTLGRTDTGGQVLYVLKLACALAMYGIKVDIYTRWFDKSKPQIEVMSEYPSVRVIRIPAGNWEFIPKEGIYDCLDELSENMIQFIKKNKIKYDVFHGHYVDAGIVALNVAEYFKTAVFFTSHSLGAWKRERCVGDPEKLDKMFNFKKRIAEELRIFKSVNAITITSNVEREKIRDLYSFESPKIEFIPPGVDIKLFRPLKKQEEEHQTKVKLPERFVFMVGRIARAKGHNLLLRAYLEVLKECPDVHLVIAGGALKPDIKEQGILDYINNFIKDNKLEHRVHPIGPVMNDELPPYYRNAEVFVLPARYEPFGMIVLEAMACETACVVSKFAGIEENLIENYDCMKMDPYDKKELAGTIIKLLKNKTERDIIQKNAYNTVQKKFSWPVIARDVIEFYQKYMDIGFPKVELKADAVLRIKNEKELEKDIRSPKKV